MIEIFDNILDITSANRYDQEISKLQWTYEYQPTTTLLHMHWYSNGELFIHDLCEDLMNAIQLRGLETVKASYLLAHTHGLEQQVHYDSCDFSMIYYPKMNWQSEWGGGTLVGDTLVSYESNRLVIFSCDQAHQGQPVSKQCFELRPIVVFQCYAESAMVERLSWVG